jgi:hypothetical protein
MLREESIVAAKPVSLSLTVSPQAVVTGGFVVFLALTALGGGSARSDVAALIPVRLSAVVLISLILLVAPADRLARARTTLVFGAVAALVVAFQLVPLPPSIWTALPGRMRYAFDAQAGLGPVWRPLSLTPDLTINALLALPVPLAAALWMRVAGASGRSIALYALFAVGIASAVLGLAQLATGADTALRYYAVTNADSAVGLFANRNHNAVMLAITIPLLALWAGLAGREARTRGMARSWIALGAALFVAAMAAVTGSRAGVLLTAITGGLAILLYLQLRRAWAPASRRTTAHPAAKWLPVAGAATALLLAVLLSQSVAVRRLLATDPLDEQRALWLKPLFDMAWTFAPVGAGFGSFDSIFRGFEPFEMLQTTYLNAAHNDLVQLTIEGGLGGLMLLGAFLFWWGKCTIAAWRAPLAGSATAFARAASVMTGALLVASLFDYPLRTPILAVVFAMACAWLWPDRSGTAAPSKPALPASRD